MSYPLHTQHTIPARSGIAVQLQINQTIKVINTHGSQVIDFWALTTSTIPESPASSTEDGNETHILIPPSYLSMSHTRGTTLHLSPLVGDTLVTNHRSPILTLIEDSTPGVHDTLIAACDIHRYRQLGVPEDVYHDNCVDNFRKAVSTSTYSWPAMQTPPDPLNLFMNIPVDGRGSSENDDENVTAGANIRFEKPVCKKGDYVVFKALTTCLVVMSACPQDLVKVNDMMPTEAHFVVS
ncbi:hypothetical protein PV10_05047 [Exophiala mesophila]|uniref:DUF1989 domain-containing protein n=1 Tax=Exophiala mesophila TaxID=212818 RepID=A0A0D1WWU4_EXOME|nr:uncharacterized protein PV10_05047 [Exophiala mesophila]KIV93865.1 hypothetical protein PV10_05047 [Exophiala mesophila]